jgi:hypothetical protein
LETSTARLKEAKELELNSQYEYHASKEIKEKSLELGIIYGLSSRLQLEIVSTIYTSVYSTLDPYAEGFGDIEAALFYLLVKEKKQIPAIALEGEVKIPTAKDTILGTQKFDYSAILIASKKFGKLDAHLNIGYTFVGQPTEMELQNIFSVSAAGEYELSEKFELVAEVLANTSSFLKETDEGRQIHPKIIPDEIAGLIGARYLPTEKLELALGFGYNNQKTFLIRSGVIYCF